jgi:hypothetical protein
MKFRLVKSDERPIPRANPPAKRFFVFWENLCMFEIVPVRITEKGMETVIASLNEGVDHLIVRDGSGLNVG